jgi:hypothetical protein
MIKHEEAEQTALFTWAEYMKGQIPALRMLFAIPNGGSRHKLEAVNLKASGVKAGVPDICLPVPNQDYHGLFIEMKWGSNKPQQEQREWIERLEDNGYKVALCYSAEAAVKIICKYLGV